MNRVSKCGRARPYGLSLIVTPEAKSTAIALLRRCHRVLWRSLEPTSLTSFSFPCKGRDKEISFSEIGSLASITDMCQTSGQASRLIGSRAHGSISWSLLNNEMWKPSRLSFYVVPQRTIYTRFRLPRPDYPPHTLRLRKCDLCVCDSLMRRGEHWTTVEIT